MSEVSHEVSHEVTHEVMISKYEVIQVAATSKLTPGPCVEGPWNTAFYLSFWDIVKFLLKFKASLGLLSLWS